MLWHARLGHPHVKTLQNVMNKLHVNGSPSFFYMNTSEPRSVVVALMNPKWKAAMAEEYEALFKNQTWSLVPYKSDMNLVGNKWVFKAKFNADGTLQRYKARLVAKGQTPGLDYFETFSPVVKSSTIRIRLSLAVFYSWDIQQIDVNNAFLNGELAETVYMVQPEGFVDPKQPTHVCKLHKALYGLKQAPRAWFDKLKGVLLEWGFRNSTSDASLFYYKQGTAVIYILIYVDDRFFTGNDTKQIDKVVQDLNKKFALKVLGSLHYFLGIEAVRSSLLVSYLDERQERK